MILLRSLLADADASPSQHSHLLSQHDLLGLNPQAPLELDLDVVQQSYHQPCGSPQSLLWSSSPPWLLSSSTPSPWCAAPSSPASGCGEGPLALVPSTT
jgi:hypothetical protein